MIRASANERIGSIGIRLSNPHPTSARVPIAVSPVTSNPRLKARAWNRSSRSIHAHRRVGSRAVDAGPMSARASARRARQVLSRPR